MMHIYLIVEYIHIFNLKYKEWWIIDDTINYLAPNSCIHPNKNAYLTVLSFLKAEAWYYYA